MDISTMLYEIVKLTLPALIVLAAVYTLIKKFFENDQKLRMLELKKSVQPTVLPLRFQAYERICIFLERISPNNLVMRTHHSGVSARELQSSLLTTIRTEYEHNISQQVYMSAHSWEYVKNAKEEVIKIINMAMASLPDDATGILLCKHIFELVVKSEVQPTQRALDVIKAEIRQIL